MFLLAGRRHSELRALPRLRAITHSRMTAASGRWCLECASPRMVLIEDFAGRFLAGSHLECDSCGAQAAADDPGQ